MADSEPTPTVAGKGAVPVEAVLVDNRGMLCAQGILRLMRALVPLTPGQLVRVLSTDPVAEEDYPAWCRNTGHTFLRHEHDEGVIVSFLRKRSE